MGDINVLFELRGFRPKLSRGVPRPFVRNIAASSPASPDLAQQALTHLLGNMRDVIRGPRSSFAGISNLLSLGYLFVFAMILVALTRACCGRSIRHGCGARGGNSIRAAYSVSAARSIRPSRRVCQRRCDGVSTPIAPFIAHSPIMRNVRSGAGDMGDFCVLCDVEIRLSCMSDQIRDAHGRRASY